MLALRPFSRKVNAGQAVNITEEMDMPSNADFHAANESAREAGEPHIANPGSINRGTLEQMNKRWERGKSTRACQHRLGAGRQRSPRVRWDDRSCPGSLRARPPLAPALTVPRSHPHSPAAPPRDTLDAPPHRPCRWPQGRDGRRRRRHAARIGAAYGRARHREGSGSETAIVTGAALGSFIPGVGTVVGAGGGSCRWCVYLWTL